MREKINTISPEDKGYPELLRNIYDPPETLFYKGTLEEADSNAVAIVGSRRCSEYGLRMAEKLAFELADRGVTVVSGMAAGIDTAAHRGALKAGGRTIAVMGSGFDHIYPPASRGLASLIAASGAVVTEFARDTRPFKWNFPKRNRIISGISRGVVVVEAAGKSGALITADFALEQGREVFAVPGRIDSYASRGTNKLIQSGAKLVTGKEDVLDEFGFPAPEKEDIFCGGNSLSREERKVLEAVGKVKPVHVDRISRKAGIEPRRLPGILLKMELQGFVRARAGKKYVSIRCK